MTLRAILQYNLDFKQFSHRDSRWWQLLGLARAEVYRADQVTAMQSKIVYNATLLDISHRMSHADNGALMSKTMDYLHDLDQRISRELQPWDTKEEAERQLRNSRKSIDQMVKEQLGDLDDPEYRRKFYATMNKMYDELHTGEVEEDEFVGFRTASENLVKLRKQQWGIK